MSKTRKQLPGIIEKIFNVLDADGTKTTNEIALAIKSNTQTIKKWVEIIKMIQAKPKLVVESTPRITLVRLEKKEN